MSILTKAEIETLFPRGATVQGPETNQLGRVTGYKNEGGERGHTVTVDFDGRTRHLRPEMLERVEVSPPLLPGQTEPPDEKPVRHPAQLREDRQELKTEMREEIRAVLTDVLAGLDGYVFDGHGVFRGDGVYIGRSYGPGISYSGGKVNRDEPVYQLVIEVV